MLPRYKYNWIQNNLNRVSNPLKSGGNTRRILALINPSNFHIPRLKKPMALKFEVNWGLKFKWKS